MIRHGDLHPSGARPVALAAPAVSARRRTGRRATILAGGGDHGSGTTALVDHLRAGAEARGIGDRLSVVGAAGPDRPGSTGARGATALQAACALLARDGTDSVLALGQTGALALAGASALSRRRLVLHLDGGAGERASPPGLARAATAWSGACAIRAADTIVADNAALADRIAARHGKRPRVIGYGAEPAGRGAHPLTPSGDPGDLRLPRSYALVLARPEPEAGLSTILHAFARCRDLPIVVACDWSATRHGRRLHAQWDGAPDVHLIARPTDPARLHRLRSDAWLHIHGQTGGGAMQTLVDTMAYSAPILSRDCAEARAITAGTAETFQDAPGLAALVRRYAAQPGLCLVKGATHGAVARRRYRWDAVTDAWFDLLDL